MQAQASAEAAGLSEELFRRLLRLRANSAAALDERAHRQKRDQLEGEKAAAMKARNYKRMNELKSEMASLPESDESLSLEAVVCEARSLMADMDSFLPSLMETCEDCEEAGARFDPTRAEVQLILDELTATGAGASGEEVGRRGGLRR